jgi:uncharacterized membrane protein YccC
MNKTAMRMLGTLVAGIAVCTFLAFFAQQRWLMVLCLSVYYGFCTYMMTGSKWPYFWTVSAFVCMIIMVDAGPVDSLHDFQTLVARVEENAMGILVYSLFDCVQDIKGYARENAKSPVEKKVPRGFTLDPDRFKAALTVMAAQWVA